MAGCVNESGVNMGEEGALGGCVWARGANQLRKHREWLGVGLYNGRAGMVSALQGSEQCL